MAYRVELTARAQADYGRITSWVRSNAPIAGDQWTARLDESIASLKLFPKRCPIIPYANFPGKQVRQHVFGKKPNVYRIFYEVREDVVRILHIRHRARRRLKRSDAEQPYDPAK